MIKGTSWVIWSLLPNSRDYSKSEDTIIGSLYSNAGLYAVQSFLGEGFLEIAHSSSHILKLVS